jgi:DNA-binding protein H-NS
MMKKCVVKRQMFVKWVLFVGLFVMAFGMAACGDKTPSEKAKDTSETVGDAAKTTGEAVGDAIQATGDYMTQSKEEGVKAAREKLDEIEKNWQDLLAEGEPATIEAKADLQKAREQMAAALADAEVKLMKAKAASEDGWKQDAKPALKDALEKVQKLYEDTSAKFFGGK